MSDQEWQTIKAWLPLERKDPGESKTVRVPMEDAFGPYRQELVATVD